MDHGFATSYHEMAKEGLRVVGVAIFGAGKKKIIIKIKIIIEIIIFSFVGLKKFFNPILLFSFGCL